MGGKFGFRLALELVAGGGVDGVGLARAATVSEVFLFGGLGDVRLDDNSVS